MSATPADTARRMLPADEARLKYAAEKAKRATTGRPTPPADTAHRYLLAPPGTRQVDEAKRERKQRTERERLAKAPRFTPPRIPPGPDKTCGNCGRPTDEFVRGRCHACDTHYRRTGVERSVTPRYGASKL